ncbi:hypothetical protein KUW17_02460 [Leisingera aquaemixtae]|uniref:hypothetical protein n=1 Tax=Leisingera aquaemixtae TaxID=1396826 RepID=UPI001C9462D0|nr:hypothetical protein [Leisingera aquaemixtae]MBY6065586.1 hypothetical protein [Leisingera aquaemixtae]
MDGTDLSVQSPEAFEAFGALAPKLGSVASVDRHLVKGSDRAERGAWIERLAFAGMTASEVYVFLFRATASARETWARSRHFWGKIYNFLTGPAKPHIEVPGHLLIRMFEDTAGQAPYFLQPGYSYQLRLDYAEAFADLYKTHYDAAAAREKMTL